jgi:ribosomal protein S18 acetylase RimI-like enzyme
LSKPIAVRCASSADHCRLLAIQNAALRKFAADHYDKAIIDVVIGDASPLLDEMIARDRCFVAECGGMLVGWGGWTARASARAWLNSNLRVPPPHAEVRALYVDPAWVERGFGLRLLTAIEGDMAAGGHRHADLIATLNAVAFFKRFGYHGDTVGETKLAHQSPFRWLDMSKAIGHCSQG